MPRPSAQQQHELDALQVEVLAEMTAIGMLDEDGRRRLDAVPLGVLRSNATQRHGVTRWSRDGRGHLMVDVVDLNPHLLNDNWRDYAAFVLFHEYLHVLGHRAHDRTFRALRRVGLTRQRRLVEKRSRTQEGLRGPPGIGCVQLAMSATLGSEKAAVGTCADGAKRCSRTCPAGTLNEILRLDPSPDEAGAGSPHPMRCVRCVPADAVGPSVRPGRFCWFDRR